MGPHAGRPHWAGARLSPDALSVRWVRGPSWGAPRGGVHSGRGHRHVTDRRAGAPAAGHSGGRQPADLRVSSPGRRALRVNRQGPAPRSPWATRSGDPKSPASGRFWLQARVPSQPGGLPLPTRHPRPECPPPPTPLGTPCTCSPEPLCVRRGRGAAALTQRTCPRDTAGQGRRPVPPLCPLTCPPCARPPARPVPHGRPGRATSAQNKNPTEAPEIPSRDCSPSWRVFRGSGAGRGRQGWGWRRE